MNRLYREITAPLDPPDEQPSRTSSAIWSCACCGYHDSPPIHCCTWTCPTPCLGVFAVASDSPPPGTVTRLLHDEERSVRTTVFTHAKHVVDEAIAERIDRDFRPVKKRRGPADEITLSA